MTGITAPFSSRRMIRSATRENLPALLSFVTEGCRDVRADASAAYAIRLAVEEICTNLIDHGYHGEAGPIDLTFSADQHRVVVTIGDRAAPFAPDAAPAADLESGWDERKIGGLGWHLVRNMVDELRYESDPQHGNLLTLVKQRRSQEEQHAG